MHREMDGGPRRAEEGKAGSNYFFIISVQIVTFDKQIMPRVSQNFGLKGIKRQQTRDRETMGRYILGQNNFL